MISTIRLSRARVQSAVREALDAAGFPTARLINPRVLDPDDPCVWLEVAHHAYDFDTVVSIDGSTPRRESASGRRTRAFELGPRRLRQPPDGRSAENFRATNDEFSSPRRSYLVTDRR
jgi:hypothetical protein